jgi:hypothetical protein
MSEDNRDLGSAFRALAQQVNQGEFPVDIETTAQIIKTARKACTGNNGQFDGETFKLLLACLGNVEAHEVLLKIAKATGLKRKIFDYSLTPEGLAKLSALFAGNVILQQAEPDAVMKIDTLIDVSADIVPPKNWQLCYKDLKNPSKFDMTRHIEPFRLEGSDQLINHTDILAGIERGKLTYRGVGFAAAHAILEKGVLAMEASCLHLLRQKCQFVLPGTYRKDRDGLEWVSILLMENGLPQIVSREVATRAKFLSTNQCLGLLFTEDICPAPVATPPAPKA